MRIVTGTFSHETNTFSNIPTTMEEFAKQGIAHGDEIPRRFRGTNTIEAAFMDAAEEHGFELVWTVFGSAIPGGPVRRDAFEYFRGHLLEGIQAAGAIDGVLLHLHGAMVTDDLDDGEGHLLEAIRRLVGPTLPIVTTLDLHANMTPRIIRNCNALTGYDTYPHVEYVRAGAGSGDYPGAHHQGRAAPDHGPGVPATPDAAADASDHPRHAHEAHH